VSYCHQSRGAGERAGGSERDRRRVGAAVKARSRRFHAKVRELLERIGVG